MPTSSIFATQNSKRLINTQWEVYFWYRQTRKTTEMQHARSTNVCFWYRLQKLRICRMYYSVLDLWSTQKNYIIPTSNNATTHTEQRSDSA